MRIRPTSLDEVLLIEPEVFCDARGYFLEIYNEKNFQEVGIPERFVQDNVSHSKRGVLRGLHYQVRQPQGKLIRVWQGEIFDVAVDIRSESKTFGKWTGVMLRAADQKMLWIPKGFAHGFYTLSEFADVGYKVTDFYAPGQERTLLWNDPDLAIRWPLEGEPILSEKDRQGLPLRELRNRPETV